MNKVYTFHETVRGHLHVMNEFPCEDSSVSFSSENGRYHIVAVADGHGSKSCFRSDYGSKAATEVAIACLQQFADATLVSEEVEERFYKDVFSNPRYRQMTVRRLTDTIIAEWHDRVLDDYTKNPPSTEEMGESAAEYAGGKSPSHIYGTTLIAALQMPKCLILVHQGDGRCDVFYSDGSVDQPIPWDARCEDTTTTSLCDEDAADGFRSCVISLEDKPVIACFLGCDGVEDAYRDTYEGLGGSHVLMGGVHTFYKDLLCQLAKMGQAEFENYLKLMLPDFSANGKFSRSGSGDDVSIAGIVDLNAICRFISQYEYDVKRYALEEDLFWKEDELRSKTRKHGILQKRVNEAQTALDDAKTKQQNLEKELQHLKKRSKEFDQKIEQTKADLDEYRQESQSALAQLGGKYQKISHLIRSFFDSVSEEYSNKETNYRKKLGERYDCNEQIKKNEEARIAGEKSIMELETKLVEARSAFEEYDTKYQAIDADRIRIEGEIAALQIITSDHS